MDFRLHGNDKKRGKYWIPVFTGMISEKCLHGNDKKRGKYWIPAFVGMTREKCLHGNDNREENTGFPLSRE